MTLFYIQPVQCKINVSTCELSEIIKGIKKPCVCFSVTSVSDKSTKEVRRNTRGPCFLNIHPTSLKFLMRSKRETVICTPLYTCTNYKASLVYLAITEPNKRQTTNFFLVLK